MKTFSHLLFVLVLVFGPFSTRASHLMGGYLSYQFLHHDSVTNQDHYTIRLQLFRDCSVGTAQLPTQVDLGAYIQDSANPNADKVLYDSLLLNLDSLRFIDERIFFENCYADNNLCVQEGDYHNDIILDSNSGGYYLMLELNSRNLAVTNLDVPSSLGQTYYVFIPPGSLNNSSPVFSDSPVRSVCSEDTISIANLATDPDGDSLSYSFVIPSDSYIHFAPTPPLPATIAIPPPPVLYASPNYSFNMPFGPAGYTTIDSLNGILHCFIPNIGFYVMGVRINEFRNGILICSIRRELQLIAVTCPHNLSPQLLSGNLVDTIIAGDTLCFPISFSDPNSDSIFIHSTGTIFDSMLVSSHATLPNDSGSGTVTTYFCWTPDTNQISITPYQFSVTASDNGCPYSLDTTIVYTIYVRHATMVGYSSIGNESADKFNVFPNPSSGEFNLSFSNHSGEKASMKIYDLLGKMILEKQFLFSASETIDAKEFLQKGIYVIEMQSGNHSERKKLVIE